MVHLKALKASNKSGDWKLLKGINDILLHARMNEISNYKYKNPFFDQIFLKVHFSITIAHSKFSCLVLISIRRELCLIFLI